MKKEDKELLAQVLCTLFPYGVYVSCPLFSETPQLVQTISDYGDIEINDYVENPCKLEQIKPYLRPMSSMTEEESSEFALLQTDFYVDGFLYPIAATNMVKWLNAHHFDYSGLIERGLAIVALEGMYN